MVAMHDGKLPVRNSGIVDLADLLSANLKVVPQRNVAALDPLA